MLLTFRMMIVPTTDKNINSNEVHMAANALEVSPKLRCHDLVG